MSLSTTTRRNDYTGDSATSVYAYSYRIFSNTELNVTVRDTDDAETTLTITTDYTVSGVGAASGGNVTLVNASQAWLTSGNLTNGYIISIRRIVPLTQTTDIRNQGSFFPETHEDALDYLTMIAQQQQDTLDGCIQLPSTIDPADFDMTVPTTLADSAGKPLIVNTGGDGWVMGAILTSTADYFVTNGIPPTDPSADQLAFWFDTAADQMKVWARTEWRVIA
jgi:hypothetical protein